MDGNCVFNAGCGDKKIVNNYIFLIIPCAGFGKMRMLKKDPRIIFHLKNMKINTKKGILTRMSPKGLGNFKGAIIDF